MFLFLSKTFMNARNILNDSISKIILSLLIDWSNNRSIDQLTDWLIACVAAAALKLNCSVFIFCSSLWGCHVALLLEVSWVSMVLFQSCFHSLSPRLLVDAALASVKKKKTEKEKKNNDNNTESLDFVC